MTYDLRAHSPHLLHEPPLREAAVQPPVPFRDRVRPQHALLVSHPAASRRAPPRRQAPRRESPAPPTAARAGLRALRARRGSAPPPPSLPYKADTSRPSLRTNWTRLVHPSVLIGHVSSLFGRGSGRAPGAPVSDVAHARREPELHAGALGLPSGPLAGVHGRPRAVRLLSEPVLGALQSENAQSRTAATEAQRSFTSRTETTHAFAETTLICGGKASTEKGSLQERGPGGDLAPLPAVRPPVRPAHHAKPVSPVLEPAPKAPPAPASTPTPGTSLNLQPSRNIVFPSDPGTAAAPARRAPLPLIH